MRQLNKTDGYRPLGRPGLKSSRHRLANPGTRRTHQTKSRLLGGAPSSSLLEHLKGLGFDTPARIPEQTLADLRERIRNREVLIPVRAELALTKSTGDVASAVLMRDFAVERKAMALLESRVDPREIAQRFRSYDPELPDQFWPTHFPARVVAGTGVVASGKNVFLFFPEVLGMKAESLEETFGFELIDVWRSLFEQTVFPCLPRIFDAHTQFSVLGKLLPVLDEVIYLASLFHEIGHRVGPFAISPKPKGPIRLNPFQWSIAGELGTDSLFSGLVREVPELSFFVLMQRMLAYGRRGFLERPLTGTLNTDNDNWIASYLWNKARSEKVVVPSLDEPGKWRLQDGSVSTLFFEISKELDQVGNHSEAAFQKWMENWVPADKSGTFRLPSEFRAVLLACSGVPEYPHYQPMLRR